jgi:hypothetical protein
LRIGDRGGAPGRHHLPDAADTPDVQKELFNTCAANGLGRLDHSALCQALELMANHPIALDAAAQ